MGEPINLYELVSSHFVDVFCNAVYTAARRRGGSVRDSYLDAVAAYVATVRSDRQATRRTLDAVHKYVAAHQRRLTYPEFIDQFAASLLPVDYFASLTVEHKDEFVARAVADLVAALGARVTQSAQLQAVLTRAGVAETVRGLQDYGVQTLQACSAQVRNGILARQSGIAPADDSTSALVADLKQEVRRLAIGQAEAEAGRRRAEEQLAAGEDHWAEERAKFERYVGLLVSGPAAAPAAQPVHQPVHQPVAQPVAQAAQPARNISPVASVASIASAASEGMGGAPLADLIRATDLVPDLGDEWGEIDIGQDNYN